MYDADDVDALDAAEARYHETLSKLSGAHQRALSLLDDIEAGRGGLARKTKALRAVVGELGTYATFAVAGAEQ